MSSKTYFVKRRNLIAEARKLHVALRTRNESAVQRLAKRVADLIDELRTAVTWREIQKILASVGLIVALHVSPSQLNAQSFGAPTTSPFGLTSILGGVWVSAADIDADGDTDLFVGAYTDSTEESSIMYFENMGTPADAAFGAGEKNPFGIQGVSEYFIMPTFADIDDDGDLDLFASNYERIIFFENIGSAEEPEFGPVEENPFGITSTGYMFKPVLADLDNDGDLDLLVGSYYDDNGKTYEAGISYYENTGNAESPQFAEPDQDLLKQVSGYYFALPTLADLDLDGDLDILVGGQYEEYSGSQYGDLRYYENIGDPSNPEFDKAIVNPFGLSGGYVLSYPEFADMDGDGDLDLFVGQVDSTDYDFGNFNYFENLGTSSIAAIQESDLLRVAPVPASDHIDILIDMHIQELQLTNATGMTMRLPSNSRQLDVSDLASGLYVLKATEADGTVHLRKLMIAR